MRRVSLVSECVFCEIVVGAAPATIVREWDDAIAFVPLGPCTDGHTLVIPTRHIAKASDDPLVAGTVVARAAELADDLGPGDFNLAVNNGPDAGQTVQHLHWHIVPRRPGDRLLMPWDAVPSGVRRLMDVNELHMRQRDEARAELARLRDELDGIAEDTRAERTADAASTQDTQEPPQ